jgi:hypothetical protein
MALPQMQTLIEQYAASLQSEAQAMQARVNVESSATRHEDELRRIDDHIAQLQAIHAMAIALQRQSAASYLISDDGVLDKRYSTINKISAKIRRERS